MIIQILGWVAVFYLIIGFLLAVITVCINLKEHGLRDGLFLVRFADFIFCVGLIFGWPGILAAAAYQCM